LRLCARPVTGRTLLRILEAEDVRIEMGRSLSRKEREYVRLQLELGLGVSEVVAGLKKK
jgi:hypothetical protein